LVCSCLLVITGFIILLILKWIGRSSNSGYININA
jgi:hypothetical protein